jgi:3-oxoacyl-[acyl-carrier protein] reductase
MGVLEKQVALITGGTSPSGRRIALALAAEGARVAINDINPDRLAETVEQVEAAGGTALALFGDVSKKFPVQAMFNEIEDTWGRLDILVNNARVNPSRPLLDMDEWDWRRTLDVDLTGIFVTTQVAARLMRVRGAGVIINVIQPPLASAHQAAYLAAVGGVRQFTAAAADELSQFGIRVHAMESERSQEILTLITG